MTAQTSSMTVPALLNALKSLLSRAGADNPDGDAREILCAVLDCAPAALILKDQEEVPDALYEKAAAMARRRASGEPIQYVLGSWSFMGREYKVGEGVLIPRDDTEVVVVETLKLMQNVPEPKIVDLCSGSGIIAITLYKELQNADVYAVEKSEQAFRYLQENIKRNQAKVKAILSDLTDCADDFADGSLDMIVSNPPYIPSPELPGLQKEVQNEPRLALDGGDDGCDFYRTILSLWSRKLKKGGRIAFEIGEDQYETVAGLLRQYGFSDIKGHPDIQGITRAVTAKYKS